MESGKKRSAPNKLALIGKRFGQLVVTEYAGVKFYSCGDTKSLWKCVCDCGNTVIVLGSSLTKHKGTKSCGCFARTAIGKRTRTHGKTETRAYRIWQAMRTRCRNPNVINFINYGGRGIAVCDRWEDFENFLADMGEPPDGYSIDRIDNNRGYSPENCRWANRTQQARNMRSNRNISFNGETKLLVEWATQLGIDQSSLRERLENWPVEVALTKPRKG